MTNYSSKKFWTVTNQYCPGTGKRLIRIKCVFVSVFFALDSNVLSSSFFELEFNESSSSSLPNSNWICRLVYICHGFNYFTCLCPCLCLFRLVHRSTYIAGGRLPVQENSMTPRKIKGSQSPSPQPRPKKQDSLHQPWFFIHDGWSQEFINSLEIKIVSFLSELASQRQHFGNVQTIWHFVTSLWENFP